MGGNASGKPARRCLKGGGHALQSPALFVASSRSPPGPNPICWAPPCICCCIWLRSLVGNTLWAVVLGHRAQECFDAGRSTSVRSTCCGKQAAGPLLSSNNCVNCVAKRIPEADEFFFVLPTGNALSCGHSHLASVFAPLGSYYTVAEWNSSTTCQDLRQLCLGE